MPIDDRHIQALRAGWDDLFYLIESYRTTIQNPFTNWQGDPLVGPSFARMTIVAMANFIGLFLSVLIRTEEFSELLEYADIKDKKAQGRDNTQTMTRLFELLQASGVACEKHVFLDFLAIKHLRNRIVHGPSDNRYLDEHIAKRGFPPQISDLRENDFYRVLAIGTEIIDAIWSSRLTDEQRSSLENGNDLRKNSIVAYVYAPLGLNWVSGCIGDLKRLSQPFDVETIIYTRGQIHYLMKANIDRLLSRTSRLVERLYKHNAAYVAKNNIEAALRKNQLGLSDESVRALAQMVGVLQDKNMTERVLAAENVDIKKLYGDAFDSWYLFYNETYAYKEISENAIQQALKASRSSDEIETIDFEAYPELENPGFCPLCEENSRILNFLRTWPPYQLFSNLFLLYPARRNDSLTIMAELLDMIELRCRYEWLMDHKYPYEPEQFVVKRRYIEIFKLNLKND